MLRSEHLIKLNKRRNSHGTNGGEKFNFSPRTKQAYCAFITEQHLNPYSTYSAREQLFSLNSAVALHNEIKETPHCRGVPALK
jgi:hypothetical protein